MKFRVLCSTKFCIADCQKVDSDRLSGSQQHHQPLGEFGEARSDLPDLLRWIQIQIDHNFTFSTVPAVDGGRVRGFDENISRCDSPVQLVRSATRFIKKVRGDDFDFILWTG